MKLKNLGWQSFFSLLLADVVAVSALVFVILLVVTAFGLHTKLRARQREEQHVAKIAELENQVAKREEPVR